MGGLGVILWSGLIGGGGGGGGESYYGVVLFSSSLHSGILLYGVGHIMQADTVNPLYTDTRYNDKISYTDNLTIMETLSQEVTVNQKLCRNIIIQ